MAGVEEEDEDWSLPVQLPDQQPIEQPIESDAFEGLFVASMPTSPGQSRPAASSRNLDSGVIDTSNGSASSHSTLSPSPDFNVKAAPDQFLMKTGVSDRSRRLDFSAEPSLPRPVSMVLEQDEDITTPGSTTTTEDAEPTDSAAGDFGLAAESTLPRPVSMVREDDEETTTPGSTTTIEDPEPTDSAAGYFAAAAVSGVAGSGASRQAEHRRTKSNPPVSPVLLRLRIPESPTSNGDPTSAQEQKSLTTEGLVRRASVTSIESYSRSELKSIDVPRRSSADVARRSSTGSYRSVPRSPQTLKDDAVVAASSKSPRTPTSPLKYKGMITFPSPPSVPPRGSSLMSSPEARRSLDSPAAIQTRGLSSSLLAEDGGHWPNGEVASPLNEAMSKRKHNDTAKDLKSEKAKALPLKPGEDNFDRHVSEVLDRVHAPIKFRSRPGAETPVSRTAEPRTYSGPRPKAERPGRNLTLAPAEPSPRKAATAEPEVKLYHLTQAGRSEPIKLFVRLVGEGERVMVRVGGGWADLADYLRQYAEHHGSRTVSENVLELQTASSTTAGNGSSGSGLGRRAFSGPVEPKSMARSPLTPIDTHVHPLERPRTGGSEPEWLRQAQPEFSMGDSPTDDEESPSVSYHKSVRETALGTQQKSSPKSASRPSTANGSSRSQSRQGPGLRQDSENNSPAGGFLGMAGRSGKGKGELPEQKAKWVEGMIEKVNKSASAEKSREEKERYLGEMGRVGGTRRVIFRSSSAAGGEGGK